MFSHFTKEQTTDLDKLYTDMYNKHKKLFDIIYIICPFIKKNIIINEKDYINYLINEIKELNKKYEILRIKKNIEDPEVKEIYNTIHAYKSTLQKLESLYKNNTNKDKDCIFNIFKNRIDRIDYYLNNFQEINKKSNNTFYTTFYNIFKYITFNKITLKDGTMLNLENYNNNINFKKIIYSILLILNDLSLLDKDENNFIEKFYEYTNEIDDKKKKQISIFNSTYSMYSLYEKKKLVQQLKKNSINNILHDDLFNVKNINIERDNSNDMCY